MKNINNIKIGEKYYYNNGQVEIIKIEPHGFVLVVGIKNIHTEISGSNFCNPCNVGGIDGVHIPHTCDEVDEVIDAVIEDLSEKDIFWVNIKHLQHKPFEYKKWEKITEENNLLANEVELKKEEKNKIINETTDLVTVKETILQRIEEEKGNLDNLISKVTDAEKRKIVLEDIPEIKLTNSNLKISTKQLIDFIKDSVLLRRLEAGGLDNWTWYDESLPDCDDPDEFFYNEALELLSKCTTKTGDE